MKWVYFFRGFWVGVSLTLMIVLVVLLAGCAAAPKPTTPPTPKMLFKPLYVVPVPVKPQPLKQLPQPEYSAAPAVRTLQYSYDLVHWHNLVHFQTRPPEIHFTAPKVGSCFFRIVNEVLPGESFQQRPLPPGLDVNQ